MENPESEPTPKFHSGRYLNRYYGELRDEKNHYANLLLSAERLLDNEGLGEDDRTYAQLYGTAIPTIDQYLDNRQSALDQFAALPVDLVSHWIDASKPIGEIAKWYDTLARRVAQATTDHLKTCYEFDPHNPDVVACERCDRCPRRLISSRLQSGVLTPDFKGIGYMVEPYRTRSIALDKFEVAMKTKIITNREFVTKATVYAFDFDRRFQSVPRPDYN